MYRSPDKFLSANAPSERPRAFTLVEMLVVLAVISILLALVVPVFTSMQGAAEITKAAYDIQGVLEEARTFAMGNNTYVWVGFFEEDGSRNSTIPATSGLGRVVISVVASQDGTRYGSATSTAPGAFGAGATTNQVALTQINKLIKVNNAHLAGVNDGQATGSSTNNPNRPPVAAAYQVGDGPSVSPNPNNGGGAFARTTQSTSGNATTFTYPPPLSAAQPARAPQYTFAKIIEFSPQGEASKITENTLAGAGVQNWIEVAIQPTRGGTIDPRYSGARQNVAAAAILIEGLSGRAQLFRP